MWRLANRGDACYRIVVLPNLRGIALPVLERLADFCRTGGTVIATRRVPETAYGLRDREKNQARVKALVREIFGFGPAGKARRNAYGQGQGIVVPDEEGALRKVLTTLGPEVRFDKPDLELALIHRGDETRHLYFVSNVGSSAKTVEATFRDGNGAAEFWDPMTGRIAVAPVFTRTAAGSTVPLYLEPHGSIVVAFEGRASEPVARSTNLPVSSFAPDSGGWTARVTESGAYWLRTASGTQRRMVSVAAAPVALSEGWTLSAPGQQSVTLDRLRSWTAIAAMKHFSGKAEYRISVDLPPATADGGYWLDLGDVREIADVRVNGQPAGVRWKAPYRLDITAQAKPGPNEIRVAVTNLLINRILGEPDPDYSGLMPPRFPPPMEKEMIQQPLPSGLLGPARVVPYATVRLGGLR